MQVQFEDHPTDPDKIILRKRAHVPEREWVGLTDEEIKVLGLSNYVQVVKIVETLLKVKNA